ncbi:hypothetical protein FKM82_004129 [Ascaphus truei]
MDALMLASLPRAKSDCLNNSLVGLLPFHQGLCFGPGFPGSDPHACAYWDVWDGRIHMILFYMQVSYFFFFLYILLN